MTLITKKLNKIINTTKINNIWEEYNLNYNEFNKIIFEFQEKYDKEYYKMERDKFIKKIKYVKKFDDNLSILKIKENYITVQKFLYLADLNFIKISLRKRKNSFTLIEKRKFLFEKK